MSIIIIICGLPGVGKSTISNDLARLINAVVLSSDKIRKEIFPRPTYTKFERRLIYDILRNDYSDADISIYKRMKDIYQPLKMEHITVDTRQPSITNAMTIASRILKNQIKTV